MLTNLNLHRRARACGLGAARTASLAWLAAAALAAAMPAWAARPLVTEDAAVLSGGECALESYAGRFSADGSPASRLVSSQWGCDAGHNTQLSFAAARVAPSDGLGDLLTLAGKTSFAHLGDSEWSLAYGLVARRTSGLQTRMDQRYATLVTTVQLTPSWATHLNLGWSGAHQPGAHRPRTSTTRWAAAVEHAVSDELHLVAETFADDHNHRPWVQVGFWAALAPRLTLNASYGRDTHAGGARALTFGLTACF